MTAGTSIFPDRRRGTALALVTSGTNLGALLFMLLYTNIFQSDTAGVKQNLSGFFTLIGVQFCVVNICGLIVFKEVGPKNKGYNLIKSNSDSSQLGSPVTQPKQSENSELSEVMKLLEDKTTQKYSTPLEDIVVQKRSMSDLANGYKEHRASIDLESGYVGSSEEGSDKVDDQDVPVNTHNTLSTDDVERAISIRDLIREPVFILMGCACIITTGVLSMDLNNLVTFTVSLDMTQYSNVLPYLSVSVGLIGKLSIGYISDITIHRVQRETYVFIMGIINTGLYVVCMFFLANAFILIINPLLVNTGSVVMFSLTPTILSDKFGTRSFAKCWGIIYFGTAVSGFFFQILLGWFYDLYVQPESTTNMCYGMKCFRWSFFVASIMYGIATFLVGSYIVYKKRKHRK